jgi:hypothetical protein
MRSKADIRPRREKVLILKFISIDWKRTGVIAPSNALDTSRMEQRSSFGTCDRKPSRVRSVFQNLAKLVEGMFRAVHVFSLNSASILGAACYWTMAGHGYEVNTTSDGSQ